MVPGPAQHAAVNAFSGPRILSEHKQAASAAEGSCSDSSNRMHAQCEQNTARCVAAMCNQLELT